MGNWGGKQRDQPPCHGAKAVGTREKAQRKSKEGIWRTGMGQQRNDLAVARSIHALFMPAKFIGWTGPSKNEEQLRGGV